MKKTLCSLLMMVIAVTATAQTIGEAFYIYRNDGGFNAFFREEVDSIVYSNYDNDSIWYDDVVTQVIYTPDSIYRIPLAAIDSVGFVQPETIYREGTIPLVGDLFDYLVKADSMTLTFDASLPVTLTPQAGDKLVNTDITDKLPYGFIGQVRQVSSTLAGVLVQCDSIGLADAVSKFYGVYDINVGENGVVRSRGIRKGQTTTTFNYDLPVGHNHLPPIDLSAFVKEKDLFDINYKNSLDVTFTPKIRIKVTRVVDDILFLSHTNLFVVTDVDAETILDISGEANKDWKKSFLAKQDFIIPPCIPFYFDIGVKASLSGEIAAGFTINNHIHTVADLTYYDASLLPLIGKIISPIINRVDGNVNITTFDMEWDYLGFRAELKPCLYIRVGIPAIVHVAGWTGLEFDGGAKLNGELMFDFRRLHDAEPSTAVYDELKDMAKLDIKPYIGAHFMAAAVDDHYSFRLGKDFENPLWTWYQGRFIPRFSETQAMPLSATKAQVKANITNDCPIPYTVGFALYDENNNFIKTELYGDKYWTRHAFPSFSCEFDGLDKDKKYKVYPIIRFFGKHDMLASPSAELIMDFPVKITDFKQTGSEHKENGFTYDGKTYSYKYDVAVTVELTDSEGVEDWGYAYLDPNGQETLISLKNHSSPYTDTNYVYYRNESKSTVTLYEYVKYEGEHDYVYGEPKDYEVRHSLTYCPDNHHPHMIDLGLPSGTLWACCNVGATIPEGYGGYYAWGETNEKGVYNDVTYQYATGEDENGDGWYDNYVHSGTYAYGEWQNLGTLIKGSDHSVAAKIIREKPIEPDYYSIVGTSYDVAHVKWGGSWVMPSHKQQNELVEECFYSWTTKNGVYGGLFTSKSNGASIFIPAAGNRRGGDLKNAGKGGTYWSGTQGPIDSNNSCYSFFNSQRAGIYGSYYSAEYFGNRSYGFTVRPVSK